MNFAGIGKIGAFVKQKNLIYAANYKIKTGQSIVDSGGRLTLSKSTMFNSVQYSKKTSTSTSENARLASIKQKLKSGKKLSAAEMSYLREKDEKLYKKAKYADEAREQLKADLQSAKTKQEAQQAVMRATAKIAADCSADFEALKGNGGGGISFGGNMNVDGEIFSSGDISSVAGTENISAENFVANTENISAENPVAGTENISAENPVASTENFNAPNENSVNQNQNSAQDSDSAFDILDKYIYAIRAIQDEWLEFIKSDNYKDLPQDIFEKNEIKISTAKIVDALFSYKKIMELQ